MKKTVTTAMLVALCAGTANSSENTSEQANLAQPLKIELTATIAGPESTTDGVVVQRAQHKRLTTADVVDALGTSLDASFSTNAQLLLALSETGALTVSVKDGAKAGVDVTSYFVFDPSSNYIESVSFRTNTGTLATNFQAMETFGLQNEGTATALPWHFTVSGVAEATYGEIDSGGTVTAKGFALSAQVSGFGDYEGAFALFEGFISTASAEAGAGLGSPPEGTANAQASSSGAGAGRSKHAKAHAKL
jgi:hypothetical protein